MEYQLSSHDSKMLADIEDIRDFIEWVCSKAERFGLNAELKRYTKGGSGSSDAVSVNPLEKNNETH